jgi:hypothetical protein
MSSVSVSGHSFEENIKRWVATDNKIKEYNEELRKLRDKRQIIFDEIYDYAEENNLKNATIQLKDSQLKFQRMKVSQGLSLKYVKECLEDCIEDEDVVKTIMKHIQTKREPKYVEDMKRIFPKDRGE